MLKLMMLLGLEIVAGIALGGVILAVLIPTLTSNGWMTPGDRLSRIVVPGTLALTVVLIVFRPGGAVRRLRR